jgi:hypothetical protein
MQLEADYAVEIKKIDEICGQERRPTKLKIAKKITKF